MSSKKTHSPIASLEATTSCNPSTSSTLGINASKSTTSSFNTVDLHNLSFSTSDHPVEQADWIAVNEKLRKYGLHPISLTDPLKCRNESGFVVLDENMSELVRKTLLHLLQENERRQKLCEDLNVKSNKTEKDNEMLHCMWTKQEQASVDEKSFRSLLEEKYEQRIEALQEEINDLRISLGNMRQERKQEKSTQLHQETSQCDLFSRQRSTHAPLTPEVITARSIAASSEGLNVKLQKYKRKYTAQKLEMEDLRNENGYLNFCMKQMKDDDERRKSAAPNDDRYFKEYKKLEKILELNNLHYLVQDCNLKISTKVNEIDKLPITECQRYLCNICETLRVDDVNDALMEIKSIGKRRSYVEEIEKLLEKIYEILTKDTGTCVQVLEKRMKLLTAVDQWRCDREQLKDIYSTIEDISLLLVPWRDVEKIPANNSEVTTSTIKQLLKDIRKNACQGPTTSAEMITSAERNEMLIKHFMKLFDVSHYDAVYTRMHDLYVKHFELVNVFHSIQEILQPGANGTLNNMVDAVGQLAKARHLLHVHQLDSVIKRIEKYDEFYEAFHTVAKELLQLLGVDNLEEVVPAVKSLLRFP